MQGSRGENTKAKSALPFVPEGCLCGLKDGFMRQEFGSGFFTDCDSNLRVVEEKAKKCVRRAVFGDESPSLFYLLIDCNFKLRRDLVKGI